MGCRLWMQEKMSRWKKRIIRSSNEASWKTSVIPVP